MTEAQQRFIEAIRKTPSAIASTADLAKRMRTSRVAVVSIGNALERKKLVCSFRGGSGQWAPLMWALQTKAQPEDKPWPFEKTQAQKEQP